MSTDGCNAAASRLLGSEGWTFDVAGGSTGDAVNGASNLSEDRRARQSGLFDALDRLEERLARSRYLAGGRLTEADGDCSPRWCASTRSMSGTSVALAATTKKAASEVDICALDDWRPVCTEN